MSRPGRPWSGRALVALALAALAAAGCQGAGSPRGATGSPGQDEAEGGPASPGSLPPTVIVRPAREPSPRVCTRAPFAIGIPLAEASGATYVPDPEAPYLVAVGDSGQQGQMVELDPDSGEVLRAGHLPLDRGASDDLEGLSLVGDTLYGITSSGWMRHWRRLPPAAGGTARYELVRTAYPVAPSGTDPELVCRSPHATNCARNYEGLCLRNPADPEAHCAGFAASKTDGVLYCLVFRPDGSLAIDPSRAIAVTRADALSGCHFAPDEDVLWAGTNLLGGNRVFAVTGWDDPARARVAVVGVLGSGFGEAIAVGPGRVVYRFSDTATARSLVDKYICE